MHDCRAKKKEKISNKKPEKIIRGFYIFILKPSITKNYTI